MALIKCKECGKEISDQANACPNCGCPTTIICAECGKEINNQSKVCPYCGWAVKTNCTGSAKKSKVNNMSTVAGVCAGIGLLINPYCILSILAVIFGCIGLSQMGKEDKKGGTVTSIILGIIEILFFCYILNKTITF